MKRASSGGVFGFHFWRFLLVYKVVSKILHDAGYVAEL